MYKVICVDKRYTKYFKSKEEAIAYKKKLKLKSELAVLVDEELKIYAIIGGNNGR